MNICSYFRLAKMSRAVSLWHQRELSLLANSEALGASPLNPFTHLPERRKIPHPCRVTANVGLPFADTKGTAIIVVDGMQAAGSLHVLDQPNFTFQDLPNAGQDRHGTFDETAGVWTDQSLLLSSTYGLTGNSRMSPAGSQGYPDVSLTPPLLHQLVVDNTGRASGKTSYYRAHTS